MKPLLAVCVVMVLPLAAQAQVGIDPSAATVLIRVVGNVRVEVEQFGTSRVVERRGVPIGSGSGFIVSPHGYVVTAHHVVAPQRLSDERPGMVIKAQIDPTGFEIAFDRNTAAGARPPVPASLVASDPARDVALLFATGSFPYLPLGDSDALDRGQLARTFGYPFGDRVDELLGNPRTGDAPDVTVTSGTITALRFDHAGGLEFIQTDSRINPGNSGGPVVDEDGYVLGVVVSQVEEPGRETRIGFAVPINIVKGLMEINGFEQALPVRRVRLGPVETFASKGLRARLLEGRADISPFRARLDLGGADDDVTFRIDRLFTPWTLQAIEQWLLNGGLDSDVVIERRKPSRVDRARRVRGGATGRSRDTPDPVEVEYLIADVGSEKIVARVVGPAEQVAFNRSIVAAALSAIEAEPLLRGRPVQTLGVRWAPSASQDAPPVAVPMGWLLERSSGAICGDRAPAGQVAWVSPADDFTFSMRVVWWPSGVDLQQVMTACGNGTAQMPFVQRSDWVGVSYVTHSLITRVRDGTPVQLAVIAQAARSADARAVLTEWARQAGQ